MLVIKLKGGGWKTLDERINSPVIAMAVINEYLKSLPRGLWSGTKPEHWRALPVILREVMSNRNIEKRDLENSRMEAYKLLLQGKLISFDRIFENMKTDVRRFSAKLLMTLHEVITRCDDDLQEAAAQRLSEFFAPSFLKNSEKSIEQTPLTFQKCVTYLIENAPFIFGSEDAPIYSPPGRSNVNYQQQEDNIQPHRTFLL
ncbi:uncharacterized protein TNIN_435031 [Trichonephila inaurata madagascariensis]|uniref:Rho-GAP domain-containing protein n=1 Tax=Trichonephila inaurata madagascariensis TaxID=2747483 RepID=A0A8X7C0R0_9ARAC|nr:uncharacterized protein TNIN_435031 [Trichonephila inaurata madagascariensis]